MLLKPHNFQAKETANKNVFDKPFLFIFKGKDEEWRV